MWVKTDWVGKWKKRGAESLFSLDVFQESNELKILANSKTKSNTDLRKENKYMLYNTLVETINMVLPSIYTKLKNKLSNCDAICNSSASRVIRYMKGKRDSRYCAHPNKIKKCKDFRKE